MTTPGIPNDLVLSTSCFGNRLSTIEDQAFATAAMGFRKIELGLSENPVSVNGFEDTRRETGLEVVSVMAGCLKPMEPEMASTWLGSPDPDQREQAALSVRRHIHLAQQLGAPVVVLRGGSISDPKIHRMAEALAQRVLKKGQSEDYRDGVKAFVRTLQRTSQTQIEHFCRSMHALHSEFPETRIAIEPGEQLTDLLHFEAVGWVLSDLARHDLGYWHHVGRVHTRERAGLPPQGQWLEAYADHMVGIHLMDAAEEETRMPPGSGEVDFALVNDYLPDGVSRVVEVKPRHGRAEILLSVRFLVDQGLG